jgi:hypothetical protein
LDRIPDHREGIRCKAYGRLKAKGARRTVKRYKEWYSVSLEPCAFLLCTPQACPREGGGGMFTRLWREGNAADDVLMVDQGGPNGLTKGQETAIRKISE